MSRLWFAALARDNVLRRLLPSKIEIAAPYLMDSPMVMILRPDFGIGSGSSDIGGGDSDHTRDCWFDIVPNEISLAILEFVVREAHYRTYIVRSVCRHWY